MVSLDDFILVSKEGAEERYELLKEKRRIVYEAASERRISVRGVENLAAMHIGFTKGINHAELYDRMLSYVCLDDIPARVDVAKYNIENSASFLWRAYTFVKIAQILNLRNSQTRKNRGSTSLFKGVANCSDANTILKELSNKEHNIHPRILIKKDPPQELVGINGYFYSLGDKWGKKFIMAFEHKLVAVDGANRYALANYDEILRNYIRDLRYAGLISIKNRPVGERNGRKVRSRYYNISRKNLELSKTFYNNTYSALLVSG